MATGFFDKYLNPKIKRFLVFLLLASLLWVLTKFGRDFSASIEAGIAYSNLPETAVLAENVPERLNFDLTANGFEILFYKFKKPVIEIDVESFYTKGIDSFSVQKNDLIQKLEIQFNKYYEIRNLKPDPLIVNLDPIVLKNIPVIADVEIEFKKGYRAVSDYIVDPAEVTISGPKGLMQNIDSIYTVHRTFKKVDGSIVENMALQSPSDEIVAITPEEVLFQWDVSEFSEGQFQLPVEVINLPPGMKLKLVPSTLTVTFDMDIAHFKDISADNFRVVCDYSKRNKDDNFMIPQIIKQPKEALNVSVNPKKIEFYVFK